MAISTLYKSQTNDIISSDDCPYRFTNPSKSVHLLLRLRYGFSPPLWRITYQDHLRRYRITPRATLHIVAFFLYAHTQTCRTPILGPAFRR